jgi:hypothetical protein
VQFEQCLVEGLAVTARACQLQTLWIALQRILPAKQMCLLGLAAAAAWRTPTTAAACNVRLWPGG